MKKIVSIWMSFLLGFSAILVVSTKSLAFEASPPSDKNHPGSEHYLFDYEIKKENFLGRTSLIYLPKKENRWPSPVLVFGHGQAIDEKGYNKTFEHLAKKGVAVIYPKYDDGFFDRDWRRMAKDFNFIVSEMLNKYSSELLTDQVVYSGHSKGAYMALMAAGAPNKIDGLAAVNIFTPAGYDPEYITQISPEIPVTLIWGKKDNIIKRSAIDEIYSRLNVNNKQYIEVVSYSEKLAATHYYMLNKSYFFGGKNGVSQYHFYGVWKWLLGSVKDLGNKNNLSNPYIYGDKAVSTGQEGLNHKLKRSW